MKNVQHQPPNPAGRLDILFKGLVKRVVEMSGNPVAKEMYGQYGQEVDGLIEKHLAPRDKRGRIIRK